MHKRLIKMIGTAAAVFGCVSNVYAIAAGMYMGVMTGPATNSAKDVNAAVAPGTQQPLTFTPVTPKSNQWGTAVFLGYKNNQYIGSELGVDYFTSVSYSSKTNTPTAGGTSARVRDIHVLLRGSLPLTNTVEVFAKLGPAFEYITTSGGLSQPTIIDGVPTYKSKHQTKIAVMTGIGISWEMNQSWVTDLTLSMLPVGSVIKNVTWIAVGLSYHFVDRYCGQFLCPSS